MSRGQLVVALCMGLLQAACGGPADLAEPIGNEAQPIVGGQVDEQTKGAVGLAINVLDLFFAGHCSGSLIAQNVVLTAQHCVSITEGESSGGGVICGQTDFGITASGDSLRVTVDTVRPEADGPAFYKGQGPVRPAPGTDNLCGFDVTLIILEEKGIPPSVATPIVPRIDAPPEAGEVFSALGYGNTNPEGGGSGTRMRIDGNVVDCAGVGCLGGTLVAPSEWRGNAPTCPGDSGGPALDADGRVIGVLSRGPYGCTSSVYGDVSAWKDFIIDTTIEAAELGGLDPPFWAITGQSVPPPPAGPAEACIGVCVDGYACARSRGERVCVPSCGPDLSCPDGFGCDADAGACIQHPVPEWVPAGGCTIAAPHGGSKLPRRHRSGGSWLAGLLGLAMLRLRSTSRPSACGRQS